MILIFVMNFVWFENVLCLCDISSASGASLKRRMIHLSRSAGRSQRMATAALFAFLVCSFRGSDAAAEGTSYSAVVTFQIAGADQGGVSLTGNNLTVWGFFPVQFVDSLFSVMAVSLNNDGFPGSGTNSTAAESSDSPLSLLEICLIAGGGTVLVVAVALAIYFGVELSKRTPAAGGYKKLAAPADAGPNKVIQVLLVHPRICNPQPYPPPLPPGLIPVAGGVYGTGVVKQLSGAG